MKRDDIIFATDASGRWLVFDKSAALGDFPTWAGAAKLRDKLTSETALMDEAPAWQPKSGGY